MILILQVRSDFSRNGFECQTQKIFLLVNSDLTGKIDLIFQERDPNARFGKFIYQIILILQARSDFSRNGSECQTRKIYLLENSDLIGKIDPIFQKRDPNTRFGKFIYQIILTLQAWSNFSRNEFECQTRKIYLLVNSDLTGKIDLIYQERDANARFKKLI